MSNLTTPSSRRADFEEVLASMAAVDRLKTRDEILAREADLPSRKADVAARLREAYQRQRVEVTDAQILAGVEAYFAGRLVFKEPRRSVGLLIGQVWADRVRLARKTARGAGLALAAGVAVYLIIVLPIQVYRNSVTSEATRKVAQAASRLHQAELAAEETFTQAVAESQAAGKDGKEELAQASQNSLVEIRRFKAEVDAAFHEAEASLSGYLPPEEKIDYAHSEDAGGKVNLFYGALASVEKPVAAISSTAAKLHELAREDRELNADWKSLELAQAGPGLHERARQVYTDALSKVALFQEPLAVRRARLELEQLTDRSRKLGHFPEALHTAAARIRTIAKDPAALSKAERNETQGLAAASSGDLNTAQSELDSLEQIAGQVMQSYTLRIVNRPGEYTRFWRYPGRNVSVKNYYLVIEPVDQDGHVVSQLIRSEEDGSSRLVSKWAERVDLATYEKVGDDKKDDGIIQDDILGRKEQGWLNPTYRMGPKVSGGDPAAGRIFRWEYKR